MKVELYFSGLRDPLEAWQAFSEEAALLIAKADRCIAQSPAGSPTANMRVSPPSLR